MKFLNDWKMKSPCVRSFMGSNVNSSSFAVISVNTIRIKMHNWAISLVSVDLSNLQWETIAVCNVSPKLLCQILGHYFTVLCNCILMDLLDDNISGLFLKFLNKESAASTKASFIISSSCKDFMLTVWDSPVTMLRWQPLLVNFTVCKNDCCLINCDFSSLTFLCVSLLFGE